MAETPAGGLAPIIIKRKKAAHHGHHGGAWKVAYADFVTAMMAFFLLLWLLNVTTEEQRNGIADYFTPSTVTTSSESGAANVLGGATITVPGSSVSESSPIAIADPIPTTGVNMDLTENDSEGSPEEQENTEPPPEEKPAPPTESQIDKAIAEREQKLFEEVAKDLRQAMQEMPDLKELQKSVIIDQTPEGLRIQLVDQEGYSMFPRGSAIVADRTRTLLDLVARAVTTLPNKLSISGHTDATPFLNPTGTYSNWELSSDRANAARRQMTGAGIAPTRIATVVGRADKEPFITDNPEDPRNRRLSIVLLREKPAGQVPPDGSTPSP